MSKATAIPGEPMADTEEDMSDETATKGSESLWLLLERKIRDLSESDVESGNREGTVQRVAQELDETGHNVSRHGGNMMQLRRAVAARAEVGRPMLDDFDDCIAKLSLEDVANLRAATVALIRKVGETWPEIKDLERRAAIQEIVEQKMLDLQFAEAKGMESDLGIRYLIGAQIPKATIVDGIGIAAEKYDEVLGALKAEQAERARIEGLLEEVADKAALEKAKHLITSDVSEEDIAEVAGIEPSVVEDAKKALTEEIEAKRRQAEEEAAAKKAAAEGPALDDIPPDEMLAHIESIREILEFSDAEDEIRTMCEQSSIPKSLVDVTVSDPDKLDELEKAAEG